MPNVNFPIFMVTAHSSDVGECTSWQEIHIPFGDVGISILKKSKEHCLWLLQNVKTF